jgi:hypothetical protein
MNRNLRSLLLSGLALGNLEAHLPAAGSSPFQFPLEKGTKWVYEGKVSWTSAAGDPTIRAGTKRTNSNGTTWTVLKPTGVVNHAQVRWVMQVEALFERGGVRAAVVCGHPAELAWGQPDNAPGYCVLLSFTNQLWQVAATNAAAARKSAQRLVEAPPRTANFAPEHLQSLALPLAVGKRWGGDLRRLDGWYCWRVEKKAQRQLSATGLPAPARREVFTLAYRTTPDHQVVEVASGVGIVRCQYEHHGTVASADVRLVEFHPGKGPL